MTPAGRSGAAKLAAVPAVLLFALAASPPAAPAVPPGSLSVPGSSEVDRRAVARIERPPLGLPPAPVPGGEPPTAAEIHLGRKLYLDRRLSRNGTLSCAMCHVPEQGFTSNEQRTAVGNEGRSLPRNAPTLLNAAYAAPFFRDGREPALELLALDVLVHPDELAAPSLGAVVAKVAALGDYPARFDRAFGRPPSVETLGRAIAAYLRSLLSAGSPFDRWYYGGDAAAVSEAVKRGFELFTGRGGCSACHRVGETSALFTDHGFHDTGIGWHRAMVASRATAPVRVEIAPGEFTELERSAVDAVGEPLANDLGRYQVTADPADRWRFKTPILRDVALTAPYMHDGSLATLREVVEFYDRGGVAHEDLDPRLRPLGLSEQEIADLVAFLDSLTGGNVDELVRDARSEKVGNPGDGGGS